MDVITAVPKSPLAVYVGDCLLGCITFKERKLGLPYDLCRIRFGFHNRINSAELNCHPDTVVDNIVISLGL